MSEPVTQAQDHDRRIGRLEGIAEQLTHRLDSLERAVAELRQAIDALRQEHRRDFRWLIGVQLTTLLALGTLILARLPG